MFFLKFEMELICKWKVAWLYDQNFDFSYFDISNNDEVTKMCEICPINHMENTE